MKRIRVLVAHEPRLMRELIMNTIADQPDFELVGGVGNQDDIAEAVHQAKPDVLILTMSDRDKYDIQCGFLLGRYPRMRILALAPEQNRAVCYWANVDIRSESLESSEEAILNAVRQSPFIAGLVECGNSRKATAAISSSGASTSLERWVH